MTDVAIRVEGLSKLYRLGANEHCRTLRESLTDTFLAPFRRLRHGASAREELEMLWALKEVSFEVKHGEVIGIIGRNGAGKSTLLKILSRITEPTEGHAEIHGRVGSLLEVGTGFHPELTGRENIFLNGAILGMKKAEIERKFDEIVAFAGVERFIDTPVKHYSSGMYVRLAFAVAAHLETEILLVDEVLAVGDLEFQRRCLGKMRELSSHGRTCLFVSHNIGAIGRLCETTLLMDGGGLRLKGPTLEAITEYQRQAYDLSSQWLRTDDNAGQFAFLRISIFGPEGRQDIFAGDECIDVELEYVIHVPLTACAVGFRVCNAEGLVVFSTSESDQFDVSAVPKRPGHYVARVVIPGRFLPPGSYSLFVAAHMPHREVYEVIDQQVGFEISSVGSLSSLDGRLGVIAPLLHWNTKLGEMGGAHAGSVQEISLREIGEKRA